MNYSKGNRSSKSGSSGASGSVGNNVAAQGATPAPTKSQHSGKVFMVMENLFYGRDIAKIYDLKGNTSNRTTKEGPNASVTFVYFT